MISLTSLSDSLAQYVMAGEICSRIYEISEPCGYFPALTGGVLYKAGVRKDLDIVFYSKRGTEANPVEVDIIDLFRRLIAGGFKFEDAYLEYVVKYPIKSSSLNTQDWGIKYETWTLAPCSQNNKFVYKCKYRYRGTLVSIDFLFPEASDMDYETEETCISF